MAKIGQQFIYVSQKQLVKQIMDTPAVQIQAVGNPKILASLASGIRTLSVAFSRLPELIQSVLLTLACSAYLLVLSPALFAVTAVMLALMVGGTHFVVQHHFRHFRIKRRAEDEIQRHYQTSLDDHKELALNRHRAEHFFNEEFYEQARCRRDANIGADAYHALAVNWGNSIMLAAVGIIFYLSAYRGWADFDSAATIPW